MPWLVTERFSVLDSIGDLTRSLENISRRVSRSMDRAIRRLEGNPVRTPQRPLPNDTAGAMKKPAEALQTIDVLTLDAELAALNAVTATAGHSGHDEAGRVLKALAEDAARLSRSVTAIVNEAADKTVAGDRQEPVSATLLPGQVISFAEAAKALAKRNEARRRA